MCEECPSGKFWLRETHVGGVIVEDKWLVLGTLEWHWHFVFFSFPLCLFWRWPEKHGWTKCWCDVSGHKSDKWNALTCGGVYKLNNFRIPPGLPSGKKRKQRSHFGMCIQFVCLMFLFSERERGVSWCASMFFVYMFMSDVCPIYVVYIYIYIVHTYKKYVRRTYAFCRRVTL